MKFKFKVVEIEKFVLSLAKKINSEILKKINIETEFGSHNR